MRRVIARQRSSLYGTDSPGREGTAVIYKYLDICQGRGGRESPTHGGDTRDASSQRILLANMSRWGRNGLTMIRMATQTHKLLPWESRVRASWRWHRDSAKGQGRPFCGGGLGRFHASAPSASKVDTAKGFAAQCSCTRGREVLQQSGRAWRHQMLRWTGLCCRASQRAEEKDDGAVQGRQGRQEVEICQSWQLALISIQWGRDLGPSAGPFRQRRRCLRPLRQWSANRHISGGADSWSCDDQHLALLRDDGRLLPSTRRTAKHPPRNSSSLHPTWTPRRVAIPAQQRSSCHPPASPSTLACPRTITESQIRAGCTAAVLAGHHRKPLSAIPHPSLPRRPYRQLLTLGATAAVAQTDMFEPETDLPRSLSAVTQLQFGFTAEPPSAVLPLPGSSPRPSLWTMPGRCATDAGAGWKHNPHSISLRFQFPSPNIHDAELERRGAGECRR